jgi:hypothetical protein
MTEASDQGMRNSARLYKYGCSQRLWGSRRRTMMVIGGVDPEGNFTATVEVMDVKAADPQW